MKSVEEEKRDKEESGMIPEEKENHQTERSEESIHGDIGRTNANKTRSTVFGTSEKMKWDAVIPRSNSTLDDVTSDVLSSPEDRTLSPDYKLDGSMIQKNSIRSDKSDIIAASDHTTVTPSNSDTSMDSSTRRTLIKAYITVSKMINGKKTTLFPTPPPLELTQPLTTIPTTTLLNQLTPTNQSTDENDDDLDFDEETIDTETLSTEAAGISIVPVRSMHSDVSKHFVFFLS